MIQCLRVRSRAKQTTTERERHFGRFVAPLGSHGALSTSKTNSMLKKCTQRQQGQVCGTDSIPNVHSDKRLGLWFRNSTEKLFNIGRIPELFCDTLSSRPETPTKEARSILVMLHGWCYLVPVYYPPTSPGTREVLMSARQIEMRLRSLVLDVEERLARGEKPVPIGTLSADDRDKWATVRVKMCLCAKRLQLTIRSDTEP